MSRPLTIWGSASPADLVGRASTHRPFPLDDPSCRLFARARHALWAGVCQLGLGDGDEVLVPAFHHGSEIEALVKAGLTCRFYEIDTSLEPDESRLSALVGARTKALLLIHYMGRPQPIRRWREWCDERGLLLLEDAAQSWLAGTEGAPVGSTGDLAIFCLYKTVPTPDGAALICDPAPTAPTRRKLGVVSSARGVVERFPSVKRVARRVLRRDQSQSRDAHDEFALGDPDTAPAWISTWMLSRLIDPTIPSQRRANYAQLAKELETFVRAPFDELPPEASPMLLPLTVPRDEKQDVLDRLAHDDIEGVDFWSVPHPSLPVEEFPRSAELRATVVGVPVHQGLREQDLVRIACAVRGG